MSESCIFWKAYEKTIPVIHTFAFFIVLLLSTYAEVSPQRKSTPPPPPPPLLNTIRWGLHVNLRRCRVIRILLLSNITCHQLLYLCKIFLWLYNAYQSQSISSHNQSCDRVIFVQASYVTSVKEWFIHNAFIMHFRYKLWQRNIFSFIFLQSVPLVLAEFRHNKIVQSPHENYCNLYQQH